MENAKWIVILSDTHGELPQFVVDVLSQKNVVHILHAGDVGSSQIIDQLRQVAPVSYVRGNMDNRLLGNATEAVDIDGVVFYLLHNIYDIDVDAKAAGMAAVIHGHLHIPSIEWKNGVMYLNPGSCSFPRKGHPPSVALVQICDGRLEAEIVFDSPNSM